MPRNDWNDWFAHVQAGKAAATDSTLPPDKRRELLRTGRDCARVLAWLGDYAGMSAEQSMQPWGPMVKYALFRALLACRSAYAALMWTELFDVPVRLNTPGTEGGGNWRPRMPFTAAQAAAMPQSMWLKGLSEETGRC